MCVREKIRTRSLCLSVSFLAKQKITCASTLEDTPVLTEQYNEPQSSIEVNRALKTAVWESQNTTLHICVHIYILK